MKEEPVKYSHITKQIHGFFYIILIVYICMYQ